MPQGGKLAPTSAFLPLSQLIAEPSPTAPSGVAPRPAPDKVLPQFSRSAVSLPFGRRDLLPVQDAFTPTRPVRDSAHLVGRVRQLERAISAIELERAHLVIFGERGRGKTSLANVIAEIASSAGYGVVRHACNAETSFAQLFGAVLAKVPPRYLRHAAGPVAERGATDATMGSDDAPAVARMPPNLLGVTEVTELFRGIRAGRLLIFVDEFDRLRGDSLKNEFIELLKNLSDLGARVTFVIIGVAQTLGELLALHMSIQRSLVAIHLPLLAPGDIEALIRQGEQAADLAFAPEAREALLLFAKGSPYSAQLLCYHAVQTARRRAAGRVELAHVAEGRATILEEASHVHEEAYGRALAATPEAGDLLFAAAHGRSDAFGEFTAADIAGEEGDVARVEAVLARLAEPAGGAVLTDRRTLPHPAYAFTNPTMRLYVLLRQAAARGLI